MSGCLHEVRNHIFDETKVLLRSCDPSSLVIDTLDDWVKGQNAAVACFYFDFAAQKEQSLTSTLGSLLKQIVGGLEEIPAKMSQAFRDQKKVIGGRRLRSLCRVGSVSGSLYLAGGPGKPSDKP